MGTQKWAILGPPKNGQNDQKPPFYVTFLDPFWPPFYQNHLLFPRFENTSMGQKWPKKGPKTTLFRSFFDPKSLLIGPEMTVKKVTPKWVILTPSKKVTKSDQKTRKKTWKNRKNRRLRHSKISVFPKWPFLDPLKTPLLGPPFLGFFGNRQKSRHLAI